MINKQLIYLFYCLLSFFKTSIHYLHLVYYVQTYISIYKINSYSFWLAESLFLIWNSLNDPLFGWLSDRYTSSIDHRLNYLILCGPLFCLSSLCFWYPIVKINSSLLGLQLLFSLCLYDTFLTMIDLNYNSLLIDISIYKRETLSSASAIGNALGSLPLLISYLFWNVLDLRLFRIFVTILTIIIMCGFIFVIQAMKRILYCYNIKSIERNIIQEHIPNLWQFIYNIHKHKNYIIFSLVNLIQVFHCHFNSNSIPLILNIFIPSSSFGSILLGISFLIPHLSNIYFVYLCKLQGTYYVIRNLFYIKLFFSLYLFIQGNNSIMLICLFIISNRMFTEGICKLNDLIITDLIDEDQFIYKRIYPLSALIFGTMTFLSKPGQTLAPIISSRLFYSLNNQRQDLFNNIIIIPIICSLCQIILWRKFTLHGYQLTSLRSMLRYSSQNIII
ncbi:unnamed protein product [Rotaria sp. Silwood1]|nr:unnamed protein product [Rotaria sp. Silwood1]CAF1432620.1 unnamed protein product [Rotaria sp. Silwood1]CAF3582842.1 unnamed protein product [Rotaria sp. Silwood1]CAF3656997.1 unnamed protein product [Rotaria sp. Silwood1]CAF4687584.1 unnamed protein product [Rotaria sp. Silwood1]